jgi:hypothetical protein
MRAMPPPREREAVLLENLLQQRHRRALGGGETLLLGEVEAGRGADVDALLDEAEDAGRAVHVVTGDAQAVLRRQHLEVGIGHRRDGGERHHLAVEAARHRDLLGGEQRLAVLAPEIDLVARVERDVVERAPPVAAAGAGAGRERGLGARGAAAAGDEGKERRAGDARLGVGLQDARHRRADVEVGELRLFHERGQLGRAELAPPVQLRKGRVRGRARCLAVGIGNVEGEIGPVRVRQAGGEHRQEPDDGQ